MTQMDFLGRLGRELDGAAGRLIGDRRRSRLRALLAPAAALAVVAAVGVAVWPAGPVDPEREVAAPAGPKSLTEVLSVLRRPESAADRGSAAREGREALAKMLRGEAAFRLLGTAPGGKGIVLGAAEGVDRPVGGADGDPGVCMYYPDTEGGGIGCWPVGTVVEGRAYGSLAGRVHGLAPDGVVNVRVVTESDDVTVPARDNLFDAGIADLPQIVAVVMMDEKGDMVAKDFRGVARVPLVPVPEATLKEAEAIVDVAPPPPVEGPLAEVLESAKVSSGRTPYPPGMRDEFTWTEKLGDPTSVQDVQSAIEFRAQCMWQRYWLAAVQAGDDAIARQAAAVLETAPGWPALRAKPEPHGRVRFLVANDMAVDVARELERSCADVPPGPTPGP